MRCIDSSLHRPAPPPPSPLLILQWRFIDLDARWVTARGLLCVSPSSEQRLDGCFSTRDTEQNVGTVTPHGLKHELKIVHVQVIHFLPLEMRPDYKSWNSYFILINNLRAVWILLMYTMGYVRYYFLFIAVLTVGFAVTLSALSFALLDFLLFSFILSQILIFLWYLKHFVQLYTLLTVCKMSSAACPRYSCWTSRSLVILMSA